jgi:hypothetical protein
MLLFRAFKLAFILGIVNGVIGKDFDTFEDIYSPPEGWRVVDTNPATGQIDFQIALQAVCCMKMHRIGSKSNATLG